MIYNVRMLMNFFAFIKKPIKAISLIIILFSFTSACNEQSSQDLASKSVTQTKKQVQVLLTGIDVSNYNTNINWQAVVDSGVAFVFIKATEGITYTDPMLSDHSAKVQEAGLTYGYYHFFRPKDDPIAQANHYLETVSKLKQSKRLPLVIDIEVIDEVTAAELLMSLEKFVDYLEKKGHRKPIIYSYSSFWNENFKTKFDNYPLRKTF